MSHLLTVLIGMVREVDITHYHTKEDKGGDSLGHRSFSMVELILFTLRVLSGSLGVIGAEPL